MKLEHVKIHIDKLRSGVNKLSLDIISLAQQLDILVSRWVYSNSTNSTGMQIQTYIVSRRDKALYYVGSKSSKIIEPVIEQKYST